MKRLLWMICCLMLLMSAASAEGYTPGRETCGRENCFWETPMDITDEARLWAMLTSPMTVVQGNPRAQAKIYAEPDKNSAAVGEVTYET